MMDEKTKKAMHKANKEYAENDRFHFNERVKTYIDTNVDRVCIIFYGQPRYLGTELWEKESLSIYLEAKKLHPKKPIDCFFVIWTCDTMDRHLLETDRFDPLRIGLPVSDTKSRGMDHLDAYHLAEKTFFDDRPGDDQLYGKIPVKKEVVEKYIYDKFIFANNITICWYDPYELSHLYTTDLKTWMRDRPEFQDYEIQYVKENSLLWLSQHAVMEWVYYDNKEYFDSLSRNSLIFKTRYDIQKMHRANVETRFDLWSALGCFMLGLNGQILDVHRYEEPLKDSLHNFVEHEGNLIDLYPAVGYSTTSHGGTEILKGLVDSVDYWFVFDPHGFVTYARGFREWVFDDPVEKYPKMPNPIAKMAGRIDDALGIWKRTPERLIHKFFIDKKLTIIPIANHWRWQYPAFCMFRRGTETTRDLHRWHFYDWDEARVDELFVFDPEVVDDL